MIQFDPQRKAFQCPIGEVLRYRWDPLGVADELAAVAGGHRMTAYLEGV